VLFFLQLLYQKRLGRVNINFTHNNKNYELLIIDDCFLTNEAKAIEICTAIKELNLSWSLAARADQINVDILNHLKQAGCIEIKLGVESGSEKLLKAMNKKFDITAIDRAIELINSASIQVKVFIITGLPSETWETNTETKEFLAKMGKEKIRGVSLLRFVPLPGSYIYDNPEKFGIKNNLREEECFKRMHLYDSSITNQHERTTDWWIDSNTATLYDQIYEDIKNHIAAIWKND